MVLPRNFVGIGDVHGDLGSLVRGFKIAENLELPLLCFGDVVGGDQDRQCIDLLMQAGCLVIRGNHDQWAIERQDQALSQAHLAWLESLEYSLENEASLAVHTHFEICRDGQVLWYDLQSSIEVERFLEMYPKKKLIFAAHSHRAALNSYYSDGPPQFVSTSGLRTKPMIELLKGRHLIDVGWASSNIVIFSGDKETPTVEYVFFDNQISP